MEGVVWCSEYISDFNSKMFQKITELVLSVVGGDTEGGHREFPLTFPSRAALSCLDVAGEGSYY